MNRPAFAATAPLALALLLTACGSVTGIDDLFSSGGGSATAAVGAGGAPGATTTTVGVGGASTSVTTGDAASSGATTGAGTTSAATTSAATTAAATTVAASSSSGGPTESVYCNGGPCNPGEICCFNPSAQGDHCGAPNQCGDGFVELGCNGPEDCAGGVCCADLAFSMGKVTYKGISCKQSCNTPVSERIVCSDADPTCPNGQQCKNSQILGQGYKVCN